MLEPAGHVLPSLVVLMLLLLVEDLAGANHILLLNDLLFLHVFSSHVALHLLCLHNHLARLLVLSLAPLGECSSTVSLPPSHTELVGSGVLATGQVLVSGVLTDVLEASLPHRFLNDSLKGMVHVYHALSVSGPLEEHSSEFALEMHVFIIVCHERHHLASLGEGLVVLSVDAASSLEKVGLLLLVDNRVMVLDNAHVIHLVFHLANCRLAVADLRLHLPVQHDCEEVLAGLLQPVVHRASEDRLFVLVCTVPFLPVIKGFLCATLIAAGEGVGNSSLAHFLQLKCSGIISGALISMLLGQYTEIVVQYSSFFGQGVLVLHVHLHLHDVAAVVPGAESSLFHPAVHLAQHNVGVALGSAVLLIELAHPVEALSHQHAV